MTQRQREQRTRDRIKAWATTESAERRALRTFQIMFGDNWPDRLRALNMGQLSGSRVVDTAALRRIRNNLTPNPCELPTL